VEQAAAAEWEALLASEAACRQQQLEEEALERAARAHEAEQVQRQLQEEKQRAAAAAAAAKEVSPASRSASAGSSEERVGEKGSVGGGRPREPREPRDVGGSSGGDRAAWEAGAYGGGVVRSSRSLQESRLWELVEAAAGSSTEPGRARAVMALLQAEEMDLEALELCSTEDLVDIGMAPRDARAVTSAIARDAAHREQANRILASDPASDPHQAREGPGSPGEGLGPAARGRAAEDSGGGGGLPLRYLTRAPELSWALHRQAGQQGNTAITAAGDGSSREDSTGGSFFSEVSEASADY